MASIAASAPSATIRKFSPEGGNSSIRTINLRTHRRTRLGASTRRVYAFDAAWVPNSNRLASLHGQGAPGPFLARDEFRTFRPNGTHMHRLFKFPRHLSGTEFGWQTLP